MPVATVVGGTAKLLTIPPSATGSEATLKDMIIWPSAIAIIGTHDAGPCSGIAPMDTECVARVPSRVARLGIDRAIGNPGGHHGDALDIDRSNPGAGAGVMGADDRNRARPDDHVLQRRLAAG